MKYKPWPFALAVVASVAWLAAAGGGTLVAGPAPGPPFDAATGTRTVVLVRHAAGCAAVDVTQPEVAEGLEQYRLAVRGKLHPPQRSRAETIWRDVNRNA